MKERKYSKTIYFITAVLSILIVGIIIHTMVANNSMRGALADRDYRLDYYEATKLWVIEDIREFLQVDSETSYNRAKNNERLNNMVREDLYGSNYDKTSFQGVQSVSFVDAQYTIEPTEETKVYLLVNVVNHNGIEKEYNFLVKIRDNTMVDIQAY